MQETGVLQDTGVIRKLMRYRKLVRNVTLRFIKGKVAHNFDRITFIRNYHILRLEHYTDSHKKNRYKKIGK